MAIHLMWSGTVLEDVVVEKNKRFGAGGTDVLQGV